MNSPSILTRKSLTHSRMNRILELYNSAIKITPSNLRYQKLLKVTKSVLACDTETTGLEFNAISYLHTAEGDIECRNPFPFGVSLAFQYNDKIVLVWARHTDTKLYNACMKLVASDVTKAWHNSRYDLRVLKENGLSVGGENHCTMTMSRTYWDRRKSHTLQALTEFLCPELSGWEVELKRQFKNLKSRYTRLGYPKDYVTYSHLPHEVVEPYAMVDVFMTLMLYLKLKPIMDRDFSEHYKREMKVIDVVSRIESRGMAFNSKRARQAARYPRRRMRECMETMKLLGGDSLTMHPPKLVKAMKSLGIKERQLKDKGKVTTGADVLRRVLNDAIPDRAREFIESLLTYRDYQKVTNTYLLPLAKRAELNGGIVYTEINPSDTRTGRPASKSPNLLNVPNPESRKTGKKNVVRKCFVCRSGYSIYYFDVSQQEMAMFGLYAQDERILEAYEKGEDLHQYMADQLGMPEKRKMVKNINFGVLYGAGTKTLKLMYGLTDDDFRMYHNEFPSVRDFQSICEYELRQYGYVEDFFGRRYHIPVGQAYKAVNALVQGSCASAFKDGLIKVDELYTEKYPETHMILPVYDEIQCERPHKSDEKTFCRRTIDCMGRIPQIEDRGLVFRVDVAKTNTNWAEKQELKI